MLAELKPGHLIFELVKIKGSLAFVAPHDTAKNLVTAFGAKIARLFVFNPFFSAEFPPVGNASENNLLSDRHGKVVDMFTWEVVTLMAPRISFFYCAVPDIALLAVHKALI